MKSKEFDKIENTYLKIEEKTKKECLKNNVDFYDYLGNFVEYQIYNYRKKKALINRIKDVDFNDKIKVRSTLSKRDFSTKEGEFDLIEKQMNKCKEKLFEWLDKTNNPYFFILNTVFEYGAGMGYKSDIDKRHGYIKVEHSGVQNIDIAIDYAKYLQKTKTPKP